MRRVSRNFEGCIGRRGKKEFVKFGVGQMLGFDFLTAPKVPECFSSPLSETKICTS